MKPDVRRKIYNHTASGVSRLVDPRNKPEADAIKVLLELLGVIVDYTMGVTTEANVRFLCLAGAKVLREVVEARDELGTNSEGRAYYRGKPHDGVELRDALFFASALYNLADELEHAAKPREHVRRTCWCGQCVRVAYENSPISEGWSRVDNRRWLCPEHTAREFGGKIETR